MENIGCLRASLLESRVNGANFHAPPSQEYHPHHPANLYLTKKVYWKKKTTAGRPVRKLDKKGFLRAFVTRGGVKVVKSEHQLQRMMSHWNEKLLSQAPHLSSQPTLTFRMSCVYQIVYKHPDEPFPFV